jgi:hypothetical protein
MTVKAYRQGFDCSKLLSLLSYGTKARFRSGYDEQYKVLAQVVDCSLLIREQRVFLTPPTQPV